MSCKQTSPAGRDERQLRSNNANGCVEMHIAVQMCLEWRQSFDLLDKDGDGKLSSIELDSLFASIGHKVSNEQLQEMVASVDLDSEILLNKTILILLV